MEIPFLHLTTDLKANQKYRFYSINGHDFHWLLKFWFSKADQSLYLMPMYDNDFSVMTIEKGVRNIFEHKVGHDFHLSLHNKTGVINLTTSDGQDRLRHELDKGVPVQKVTTILISTIEKFPKTTQEEINNPKKRNIYLPLMGIHPHAPIALTIYCVEKDVEFKVPEHGNTFQIIYSTELINNDYVFHFVLWQDTRLEKQLGDVAMQWDFD